jgi:hypothetical protein
MVQNTEPAAARIRRKPCAGLLRLGWLRRLGRLGYLGYWDGFSEHGRLMQQPTMSHPGGGAPGPGTCRQVLGHRVSGHLPAAATDDEPPVRVPSAATDDQGQPTPWTPWQTRRSWQVTRAAWPAGPCACVPECLQRLFLGTPLLAHVFRGLQLKEQQLFPLAG